MNRESPVRVASDAVYRVAVPDAFVDEVSVGDAVVWETPDESGEASVVRRGGEFVVEIDVPEDRLSDELGVMDGEHAEWSFDDEVSVSIGNTLFEERVERCVAALEEHPYVEYADGAVAGGECWCGLNVFSTEVVDDIAYVFGLEIVECAFSKDKSYDVDGPVLDVTFSFSDEGYGVAREDVDEAVADKIAWAERVDYEKFYRTLDSA